MWFIDVDPTTYESVAADLDTADWFPDAESFLARFVESPEAGVVVAETDLPGMTGLELVAALRRRGFWTPVVLVCANADVSMAVEAIRAGAADFFEKPVPRSLLLGSLRKLAKACA